MSENSTSSPTPDDEPNETSASADDIAPSEVAGTDEDENTATDDELESSSPEPGESETAEDAEAFVADDLGEDTEEETDEGTGTADQPDTDSGVESGASDGTGEPALGKPVGTSGGEGADPVEFDPIGFFAGPADVAGDPGASKHAPGGDEAVGEPSGTVRRYASAGSGSLAADVADHPGLWARLGARGQTVAIAAGFMILAVVAATVVVLLRSGGDDATTVAGPDKPVTVGDQRIGQRDTDAGLIDPNNKSRWTLRIAAGGEEASAGVEPVLLAGDSLIPPADVNKLGWYSSSAKPGTKGLGSTVITGHVDAVDQGPGFAGRFASLAPGTEVSVDTGDGKTVKYRVSSAPVQVSKTAELPEVVNRSTGDNQLVLVTCGGPYVGGALGYADNTFVIADPVAA